MPNLADPWYLNKYRQGHIIICSGQGAWEEMTLADVRVVERLLQAKGVPAWVDYWGYDVNHDWPWWRKQLPYFLDSLLKLNVLTQPPLGQPELRKPCLSSHPLLPHRRLRLRTKWPTAWRP